MTRRDHASEAGKPRLDSLKDGSTDSRAVEAYYDDWAESYDAALESWNYRAPDEAAVLLDAHVRPGDRILDVGCGTGLFAKAMARHKPCRIDGIDISAASLEVAGPLGLYDRLLRHDLQETPLPVADDAVDAAACVGVLTYIEEPAELLADLCRVVRAGGPLLFTQRTDRWAENDFGALIEDFAVRDLWTPLLVSDARPYLPDNDEFGDRIMVIHVLCQVA